MKYVLFILLAVILVSSLSLSSCRRAYLAGQEAGTQSGAPNTQQQAPDASSGSSVPSNPQSGSSNTEEGATANQPPVARIISISPNEATQGDTVSFKGEGTDTDGTVKAYFWKSSIDGIISRVESFDFNMLSAGTHTISFMVVDNRGAKSEVVTSGLVINTPTASHSGSSSSGADLNKPPEARINSISPTEAQQGDTIYFKGEGHDVDGTIVAYNWKSSIDGTLSNKPEFETKTLSEGTHTITFQVMDNDRAKDEVGARAVIHKLVVATPPQITNATIDWFISGSSGNLMFRWTVSGLKPNLEYYVFPDVFFNDSTSNWPGYCDPKCHAEDLAKKHDDLSNTFYWPASTGQGIVSYSTAAKPQNPHGTLVLLSYDPVSKTGAAVVSEPLDASQY